MKNTTLTRCLLICSLIFTFSVCRAQYFAIPDTNFGNWLLNNGYAAAVTGNSTSGFQLNTTSSLLLGDSVNIRYQNIHDLTGIQYFPNMTYLDCSDNHITSLAPLAPFSATLTTLICENNPLGSLPALPVSLTYLNCDTDQLSSLPALPSTLWWFTCDSNYITSLPALPAGLYALSANYNLLTTLPVQPATLYNLDVSYNQISSLPAFGSGVGFVYLSNNLLTGLPVISGLTQLQDLGVNGNRLTSLPALPGSLLNLDCTDNLLTSLPTLPNSLFDIYCEQNLLTGLPALPDSLVQIACDYNQLTTLPAMPANLKYLTCSSNSLTSLPALPSGLQQLFCESNHLSGLPALPPALVDLNCSSNPAITCLPRIYQNVMEYFYIQNTAITCVPNSFTSLFYDINPAALPLCGPASGCDFYYNIAGNVHNDTAASCQNDSLYPGNPITDLKVQLIYGGQVVQQFYTFTSGNYSFEAPVVPGYTVSIDTAWLPLAVVCPGVDSQYVSLSAADSVATGVNFGMQCSNFDYGVGYIWGHHFRPEGTSHIHIGAGNIARVLHSIDCGANMPGTVTTTLGGSIAYISPAPGALTPTSISGSTLTYTLTDLDSLTWGSLDIIIMTDTNAVAGTDACFTTIITPATADMNPYDDTLTMCFPIVHSWDPNSKSVTPTALGTNAQWLTYTVEFQNTGTDTAYTVVVRDTLSQYVDASTFQYIGSSSKAVIQLMGNAMVFTFPKINLVDSTTNDSLSTGWIQYKVKSKGNLPDNTQVANTAYIYFDNNPAVVTNTVVSTVNPTGIIAVSADNSIQLYPNPNRGTFTLLTAASIGSSYVITDILGNIVAQQTITSGSQQIDLADAAEGVYTLVVKGAAPIRFTVLR